jgi:hypothetical protein
MSNFPNSANGGRRLSLNGGTSAEEQSPGTLHFEGRSPHDSESHFRTGKPGDPTWRKGKGKLPAPRDWIGELMTTREEQYVNDAAAFWSMIDTTKMIHVVTDRGTRPNPCAAGWGAIMSDNKAVTMMWCHFPHATNNTMELRAVAELRPPQMGCRRTPYTFGRGSWSGFTRGSGMCGRIRRSRELRMHSSGANVMQR